MKPTWEEFIEVMPWKSLAKTCSAVNRLHERRDSSFEHGINWGEFLLGYEDDVLKVLETWYLNEVSDLEAAEMLVTQVSFYQVDIQRLQEKIKTIGTLLERIPVPEN